MAHGRRTVATVAAANERRCLEPSAPTDRTPPVADDAAPLDVVWVEGGGCDGCSLSVLGATAPRLEELLAGGLSRRPVRLIHPLLSFDAGDRVARQLDAAAAGELDPFVLVVEGSMFDEELAGDVGFSRLGMDVGGAPVTVTERVRRLAPRAAVVVAIGTCATWGGVPAAAGSPTGAHGVGELLGPAFRSTAGLPVVNVPGCAPSGDAFVETLSYVALHLEGAVPLDLDEQGRPAWLYGATTPLRPAGGAPPLENEHAACPVPALGWINRLGGCATVGGSCIGCTRPDFPDRTLPLVGGRGG